MQNSKKFEKTIETVISVVESGEVLPFPETLILTQNIASVILQTRKMYLVIKNDDFIFYLQDHLVTRN